MDQVFTDNILKYQVINQKGKWQGNFKNKLGLNKEKLKTVGFRGLWINVLVLCQLSDLALCWWSPYFFSIFVWGCQSEAILIFNCKQTKKMALHYLWDSKSSALYTQSDSGLKYSLLAAPPSFTQKMEHNIKKRRSNNLEQHYIKFVESKPPNLEKTIKCSGEGMFSLIKEEIVNCCALKYQAKILKWSTKPSAIMHLNCTHDCVLYK